MVLWRISPFRDLNGEGGLLFAARWHVVGFPVVYLAESPAGALLEICANTSADDAPANYTLLKVSGLDPSTENVDLDTLPLDWTRRLEITQAIGTDWLGSDRSALLRVPSALVPETFNCLLNPLHPDATSFQIEHVYQYPFDLRLKN